MVVLILENSADPDEMQRYAAFHRGLHCLPPKYLFGALQKTKGKIYTQRHNSTARCLNFGLSLLWRTSLCLRAVKALMRLHRGTGPSVHTLLAYVIIATKISWRGWFLLYTTMLDDNFAYLIVNYHLPLLIHWFNHMTLTSCSGCWI